MYRLLLIGFVSVVVMGAGCSQSQTAAGSGAEVDQARVASAGGQQPHSAVIWVKGLSCPLCVQAIKKELQTVKGVKDIDVDYDNESALVSFSSRPPSREQLTQAIERSGYVLTKLEMQ